MICSYCGATKTDPKQVAAARLLYFCYPTCYETVMNGEPLPDGRTWGGMDWVEA